MFTLMEDPVSPNLQTARIICGALMLGVAALWAVAFVMTNGPGGFDPGPILDPTALLAVVIAVALSAFAAALLFRSRALQTVSDTSRRDPTIPPGDTSKVQTNLIIAWALLEGQALVAGVFFMLTGAESLLIVSALVFAIGFAFTFPRAEWFEQAHRASQAQS